MQTCLNAAIARPTWGDDQSPRGSSCGLPVEFATSGERVDSPWTTGLRPCAASPTACPHYSTGCPQPAEGSPRFSNEVIIIESNKVSGSETADHEPKVVPAQLRRPDLSPLPDQLSGQEVEEVRLSRDW